MNSYWDKLDPGFLAPIWLAVGFFAMVAIILLEIGARRRRDHAVRQFAASHLVAALTASVSSGKRLVKSILIILAAGLLFVALARPHLFFDWREEDRSGFDILLAVDCSKSMLSEDVKPSRLERAKLAISDFGDHLQDNRLGLIAFAGDAFLQCPLTIDHEAFETAVRELDTDTIPKPGTDIATAIEQALSAFKSQPNNQKILILVTDGEDLEGRVLDAAKNAAANGLKIYTIGVGTASGDLIPERDDSGMVSYVHDSSGQIVQSKLDESTLRKIAEITGGAYAPLGQRGEGLEQIYNRYIAALPKQHLEARREKMRIERFEWPLGLAILLLVTEFLINERARSRKGPISSATARPVIRRRSKAKTLAGASAVALGMALLMAPPSANASTIDQAQTEYKSGKFDDALKAYRQAAEKNPDSQDLQYNLGGAAYKAGQYNEAEAAFRKALDTPDLKLQENSYYNLGNAQFKHGEAMQKTDSKRAMDVWKQALKSYDSALKLHHSADAQYNYDIVKKKLEELQQQQQQQQQQKDQQKDKDSKPDDKNKSGQQQQQSQDKDKQQESKDQSGKNDSQKNGQDQSQQPQQQSGEQQNKPDQQQGQGQQDQQNQAQSGDQKGQEKPAQTEAEREKNPQQNARSQAREQDAKDPGVKSRQEAEDLLDSLKDDERHVTARSLNGNNQPPPPPPSGKDW